MTRRLVLFEMDRLRKEVDRIFRNFLDFPKMKSEKLAVMKAPKADMAEKDNELVLKMNMPGLKKQDIDLRISENAIEVKAQQRHEANISSKGMLKEESSYKGFCTSFPLPAKVLSDKSKALYKKGVLEIHMPKAKEAEHKGLKRLQVS